MFSEGARLRLTRRVTVEETTYEAGTEGVFIRVDEVPFVGVPGVATLSVLVRFDDGSIDFFAPDALVAV